MIFFVRGKIPLLRGLSPQFWKVMKLTALLLTVAFIQVHARSYPQVTLSLKNAPMEKVFLEIERQAGVGFLYTKSMLSGIPKVTIQVKNASVNEVLNECFKGQPLEFAIESNMIIVKEKRITNLPVPLTEMQPLPPVQISGRVVTQSGEPLPNVSVVIVGSNTGTTTNNDGRFTITAPDNKNLVLEFSSVGYQNKRVTIGNQTEINVVLELEVSGLSDIVVVGYGTQKKGDLTGSVVSIKSNDFTKGGISNNALQMVAGNAPGVMVSQSNSEPGGNLSIQVRGAGSINSSNSVLVVVDGIPGVDPSTINPLDIKSIEILKDASSAAIYGTRAANGVILITTKSGTTGPLTISYDTYGAYQIPANKLKVLDAKQYMQMLNYLRIGSGQTPQFSDSEIAAGGKGTDWQGELFKKALAMNHNLAISGGSNEARYYASLGYLDQDGIMVSSGYKKVNALIKLDVDNKKRIKFGIKLDAQSSFKDAIPNTSVSSNENADPLDAALQFNPLLSPLKDDNGNYHLDPIIALDNPLALAYGYNNTSKRSLIQGNTFGQLKIINGLSVLVRLGGKVSNVRDDMYKDQTTKNGRASKGIGEINSSLYYYWLGEGLLQYNKITKNNEISVMGGISREFSEDYSQTSGGRGFLSDITGTNLLASGDASTFRIASTRTDHKLQSYFGRVNYSLTNKYLLTTTLRRDGTSRFSEKNKYATFPSFALGWKISEYHFMKDITFINFLKLRASYGEMGNEGIDNFQTIQTFVAGANNILSGIQVNGSQPARLANPNLKWETTQEYNYGIDFGLFNNRISGSIEYYIKNSIDQLFNEPIPSTTGFTTRITNLGEVKNTGIDLNITSINTNGQFRWTTNAVFSTLHNEVVELPPTAGKIITGVISTNVPAYSITSVGYPMRSPYGLKVIGIFQEDSDIAHSSQPNAKPGWPIFLDANSDGKIDANDRVILGSPFPSFSYSLKNSFSFANFNLGIYIYGVHGITTMNGNVIQSLKPINSTRNIFEKHWTDRWTPENPDARFPSGINAPVYFSGGNIINSYTAQDASFIRLKNITLTYLIPLKSYNRLKFASVYLSAENLYTVTNDYDGYDPDSNKLSGVYRAAYNNYPLSKIIVLGASLQF